MKIYITGCAKSGTTLLRRMFYAFEGLNVYNEEMRLDKFIESDYNVAKRKNKELFSYPLENDQASIKLGMIRDNNIKIVHIERNREDTLKSHDGYVREFRYDGVYDQVRELSNDIDVFVKFEELLSNPNKVQRDISEKLGLTIIHNFSDYPEFIDSDKEPYIEGRYSLRKLGEKYTL